jgi:hypothetical protein
MRHNIQYAFGSGIKSNTSIHPIFRSRVANNNLRIRQKKKKTLVVKSWDAIEADYKRIPFARDFGITHVGLNAGRRQSPTEMCYKLLINKCCKRRLAHHTYRLVCQEILAYSL